MARELTEESVTLSVGLVNTMLKRDLAIPGDCTTEFAWAQDERGRLRHVTITYTALSPYDTEAK